MEREALVERLTRELHRVAIEVRKSGHGTTGVEGVDIYAHPDAISALRFELTPALGFQIEDPKKMPPNAVGRFRGIWIFQDAAQPQGALFIHLNGKVYSDVSTDLSPATHGQEETKETK